MARKLFSYNRFIGLDTVTSPSNMSERFLVRLENAYVDFRGQIVRGPLMEKPITTEGGISANRVNPVLQIAHYGDQDFVQYFFQEASNGTVTATNFKDVVTQTNMFTSDLTLTPPRVITPISIVNFDQKQFAFMAGHDPYYYTGAAFTNAATLSGNQYSSLQAYPKGGMAVNILNRLVVAGIPGRETEIHISEQDSFVNWRTNTSSGTTPNATDGAIIDVKNQFTSRDTIQGLAVLEGDKLVVFGQNETLVYLADTNINLWEIARDFRVPIGLFGRNTAVNVGTDVFFCSRFGIHSLKRAASGLTLETKTFTREVEDLYQQMVRLTPSATDKYRNYVLSTSPAQGVQPFHEPHAVWDGSLGQYHVFFPQLDFDVNDDDQSYTARLTMTYDPEAGRSGHLSFGYRRSQGLNMNVTTDKKAEFCASYFAVREEVRTGVVASGVSYPQKPILGPVLVGTHAGFGKFVLRYIDDTVNNSSSNITHQQNPYTTTIRTPLLSQGSPDTYKHYKRLIIRAVSNNSDLSNLRAGGSTTPATISVRIYDSENNQVQITNGVVVENDGMESTTVPSYFSQFPIQVRPIDLPIPHRAKSISIEFVSSTEHALKILDFALVVDTK